MASCNGSDHDTVIKDQFRDILGKWQMIERGNAEYSLSIIVESGNIIEFKEDLTRIVTTVTGVQTGACRYQIDDTHIYYTADINGQPYTLPPSYTYSFINVDTLRLDYASGFIVFTRPQIKYWLYKRIE
jgi:hypothetical protein